jgi:hypothetical protein
VAIDGILHRKSAEPVWKTCGDGLPVILPFHVEKDVQCWRLDETDLVLQSLGDTDRVRVRLAELSARFSIHDPEAFAALQDRFERTIMRNVSREVVEILGRGLHDRPRSIVESFLVLRRLVKDLPEAFDFEAAASELDVLVGLLVSDVDVGVQGIVRDGVAIRDSRRPELQIQGMLR